MALTLVCPRKNVEIELLPGVLSKLIEGGGFTPAEKKLLQEMQRHDRDLREILYADMKVEDCVVRAE